MNTEHQSIQNRYAAGDYELDKARSAISVRGKSLWGLLRVTVKFDKVDGTGKVLDDGTVTGRLTVDVASLQTGIAKRDAHLTSTDFFDADRHPVITFTVSAARRLATGNFVIDGNLHVKQVLQQVTLQATMDPADSEAVQVSCRTTIDRSHFGVSANQLGMVSNSVEIHADLLFTRRT